MATIGIFGGSFDPPHVGHVLSVKYLLSVGLVDEVIVVPVFEHAFHKELTPYEVRSRLVQLAFADEPRATVSLIEAQLPRPNFTLNTVRFLQEERPGDQLRLIVGADVLHDIDRWHHFDELSERAPLIVLGRAGVSHAGAPVPYLPQVSSTEIRNLLAAAAAGDATQAQQLTYLLPRVVLEEIRRQHWYE